MELSAITDEISMDFEYALDVMQEYGLKTAELRSMWDSSIVDLSDDQLVKAKSALKSRGMTVCGIASPFYKCDLHATETGAVGPTHQATARSREQQMALLDKCIRLAEMFDTKIIRVFSFWRKGEMTEEIEKEIAQAYEEPLARAEKAGIILALENEHSCYLGTGEETVRVLRRVNSPTLRAVWDPGNEYAAGGKIPYPGGYEAIKDFIIHVHVKDAVWEDGKAKFVRIGDGDIDYAGQFRALKADGYDGIISLETHYRPDGNAEEGSRQCLASLKEMLED